jgi:hypothetical protein
VSLRNSELGRGLVALTDDGGRFEFRDLPAGRFTISVMKAAYVMVNYGSRRPQMPGLTIVVADGQRIADLAVRMPRGAVIAGRVVDEQGQPAVGLRITASERVVVNGEPSYAPGFVGGGVVDDRGMYRLYGLRAGSYVIAAAMGPSITIAGLARVTTPAEVQWAQSTSAARPGMAPVAQAPPPRGQSVRYTTVFYPGTTDHASALPITVAAGEERTGVDFIVRLVPTATVDGTIVGTDGRPVGTNVQVMAFSNVTMPAMGLIEFPSRANVTAEGRFSLSGLAPGQYVVTARASSALAPRPQAGRVGGPAVMDLWATEDVGISGADVSGLVLRLSPGMTVSGRVVAEATREAPPSDFKAASVRLVSPPTNAMSFGAPFGETNADGTFRFAGVPPGAYYVMGNLAGGAPGRPAWTLKSATLNGRDVADTVLEVRPGEDIGNIVVTFTDRVTTLSGSLTDQTGQPAPGYFVMAFPANPSNWRQQSRWMRPPVRPASDGRFSVVGLPPGDYYLAAITEFQPNEWYTPAFLQALVPMSLKLALREGEEHRQDIRLAGN